MKLLYQALIVGILITTFTRLKKTWLCFRISDSIQRKVESSGSFETLSDSNRPSQLIERYSQLLYCELRPDAMDALDDIIGVSEADDHQQISDSDSANVEAIAHSTDLKQKILFSVVVVSCGF